MKPFKTIAVMMLTAWLCVAGKPFSGHAGEAGAGSAPKLPGSDMPIQVAAKDATDIVVAQFIKTGNEEPDPVVIITYTDAQIAVYSSLKGTLTGKMSKLMYVRMRGNVEAALDNSTKYIMFIERDDRGESGILKFLLATDDNINVVKAVLDKR